MVGSGTIGGCSHTAGARGAPAFGRTAARDGVKRIAASNLRTPSWQDNADKRAKARTTSRGTR